MAVSFALHSLPVRAAEFLTANDVEISGEVIRFTDSTVTIRPAIGSMIILAPGDIKSVRYKTNDGGLIKGALRSWHDGVYVIEADATLISVRDGTITSETTATAPKDQNEEGTSEQTLDLIEENQSAGVDTSTAEAVDIVQIKATAEIATEETEVLVFDISSSKPPDDDIILVYATIEDTAKAGLDFVEKRGVLVFPAGEVSTELTVPLIDDDEAEGEESMRLFLSGAPDVATIPLTEITATIIDNDS